MQEITPLQYSWSKKRILLGLIILMTLIGTGYLLKNSLWDKNKSKFLERVKGESIKNEKLGQSKSLEKTSSVLPPTDWKNDLEEKLDLVKKQVNNLSVTDLASSSPQIKKVIENLQSLQQLPRNQAKEACYNICKGL